MLQLHLHNSLIFTCTCLSGLQCGP